MSWANYDAVVAQLTGYGLAIDAIEVGSLQRVKADGDRGRERTGWYSLHEHQARSGDLILVGAYGCWRDTQSGRPVSHRVALKRGALSPDEREAIKARIAADRKRAAAARREAATRAARYARAAWGKCLESGQCQYLERKGVSAHGARFSPRGNLVIPIHDVYGTIHGLQIVYGDPAVREKRGRDKDYWPAGLAKRGHFYLMGSPAGVVLLCEGFATGASLQEATGLAVAVAFDAGGLLPVAQSLAKYYTGVHVLVCADDDFLTPGNPGVSSASAAAMAVGGAFVAPRFESDRVRADVSAAGLDPSGAGFKAAADKIRDGRAKLTDFNDLHQADGLLAVRSQVEAAIHSQGWALGGDAPPGAERVTGGAGERLKPLLTVDEACDRFALIFGGKGTFFDCQEHDLIPKSDVMDILPDHGWREWKLRPERQVSRLSEVGFDPGGADPNITCNLWAGWPTEPAAGRCETLLDLLQYLCSDDKNDSGLYEWVLKWLAYPLQHPGAKMKTSLIFHGGQGAGKNLFFEAYMAIYGPYGRVVDQSAIEDRFNDWASKKLFLIADEVVARNELFHVKNKLKALVTGDWIRINPKNVAAHDERNHVNFVFLSNEKQPLVLEKDDRRYVVIWTPPELDHSFYGEVADEIKDGGIAALHDHLLNLDLCGFTPHERPPMTQAKRALIGLSLSSEDRFLADWQAGETGCPFCPAASMDLYAAYLRWCRANGVARPRESNQFLGHINRSPGWHVGPKHVYEDLKVRGKSAPRRVVIPPDDLLRQGEYARAEAESQTEWLTGCLFEFRRNMEEP